MECVTTTKNENVFTGPFDSMMMMVTRTGCGERISDGFELPKDRDHWKKWKFCPFCGNTFVAS